MFCMKNRTTTHKGITFNTIELIQHFNGIHITIKTFAGIEWLQFLCERLH